MCQHTKSTFNKKENLQKNYTILMVKSQKHHAFASASISYFAIKYIGVGV